MREKQIHTKKNSVAKKTAPTKLAVKKQIGRSSDEKTTFLHPAHDPKSSKTKSLKKVGEKKQPSVDTSIGKKKHRFRPGTKALQEIRKYQKGTDVLLPRAPFQRVVREVLNSFTEEAFRCTAGGLECLQTAAEAFIIQVFEDSVLAMIHSRRVTLMVKDVQLIRRLRGM